MTFDPIVFSRVTFDWKRPLVMGILNVTPDSFSDGGKYEAGGAVAAARAMVAAGADVIDVGGESTRPGAKAVSWDEECARVIPVIAALAADSSLGPVVLSVDTVKSQVAKAAINAGAEIVNDISGGRFDANMMATVAATDAAYILGHVRGANLDEVHQGASPAGHSAGFDDVVADLKIQMAKLLPRLAARTIIDPCLGFGKKTPDNVELTCRAGEMAALLGAPILLGPSRKRFIGDITGAKVHQRDGGTVGACLVAVSCGANMVRVHDVFLVKSALAVYDYMKR